MVDIMGKAPNPVMQTLMTKCLIVPLAKPTIEEKKMSILDKIAKEAL